MSEPRVDTKLLLEHAGWVRSLAHSLVYDPDTADDVVQQTWMSALRNPPRQRGSVRAWLAAVVRNAALQSGRNAGRRGRKEAEAARSEAVPGADEQVERLSLHRELVDKVRELPDRYRTVVLLRYFDDMPPREIARRLGVESGTVRTRLSRALDYLRAQYDRDHGDRLAWCLALAPLALPGAGRTAAASSKIVGVIVMSKKTVAACLVLAVMIAFLIVKMSGDAEPVLGDGSGEHADAAGDPDLAAVPDPLPRRRVAPIAETPGRDVPEKKKPAKPIAAELTPPPRPVALGPPRVDEVGKLSIRLVSDDPTLLWRPTDIMIEPAEGLDPLRHAKVQTTKSRLVLFEEVPAVRTRVFVPGQKPRTVVVAPNDVTKLEIEVKRNVEVRVQVVDPEGERVRGAEFWWYPHPSSPVETWGSVAVYGMRIGRADPRGHGRFDLPPDTYLVARAPGFAPSKRHLVGSRDGRKPSRKDFAHLGDQARAAYRAARLEWFRMRTKGGADMKLGARGTAVRGRVLDADGRSVRGASVLIGPDPRKLGRISLTDNIDISRFRPLRVFTDDQGRYRAFGVEAGPQYVSVFGAGHMAEFARRTLDPGAPEHHESFTLQRGAVVTGRILGGDGAPLAAAPVRARGFRTVRGTTAVDGSYRLEGVEPGAISMSASSGAAGLSAELGAFNGEVVTWSPKRGAERTKTGRK